MKKTTAILASVLLLAAFPAWRRRPNASCRRNPAARWT
jgi:hypothetical protein